MILNVGCGGRPLDFDKSFGDVRLDIERFPSVTIIADAQNLPFKDKTFELVYASHLLEHLENPFKVIKEFKRVSKNMVVVKVPNAVYYKTTYESPEHIYSWNESTLYNFLKRCFSSVVLTHSNRIMPAERRSKIRTAKRLVLSMILKTNELTAICK